MKRIHDRFDFFKDPDNMVGRPKSKFDLPDKDFQIDDGVISTELSDSDANDLYRRFKIIEDD